MAEEENTEMAVFTQHLWNQIAEKMGQSGGTVHSVFSDLQSLILSLQVHVLCISLNNDLEVAREVLDQNKSQVLDVLVKQGWQ